jgi:uncharacterized protein (TIGR02271 family)
MSTLQKDDLLQKRGEDLYDHSGDKIGSIQEIYLDADTGAPEWALVNTGLFGTKSTFVPLRDATDDGGSLRVPYEKAQVKDAPKIDPDGELSQDQEAELYRHYGLDYSESRSDSGLPEGGAGATGGTATGTTSGTTAGTSGADIDSDRSDAAGTVGHDTSGPTTDQAMTRSEEELQVGTTQRESGRARLRKYVVEDEVTETVPVQREEVRIEREPITDANIGDATEGPAISDEEHEVVLHQEDVVAEKRAVPKERIRLDKDTVTEEQQLNETVRKEEIDVDDQGRSGR